MNGTGAQRREHGSTAGSIWICLLLALAGLAVTERAPASEIKVNETAAAGGTFGLEVQAGIGCAGADLVIPAGSVTTDQTSCATITTATPGPVTVDAAGVDFLTGSRIKFDADFAILEDAFTAKINQFIDSPLAFLTDDSPDDETNYWAFYRINLDPLTLALGEDIGQLVGYNSAGTEQFRVVLRRNAAPAENRIAIQARDNTVGGLVEHDEEFPLAAGVNIVAVWWRTADGLGQFLVSVNGTPLFGLDALDNDTSRLESVRLGFVDGNPAATTGSYYLDDFSSFRTLAP